MAAPQPVESTTNIITHPLFATDPNQNQNLNQNQNGYNDASVPQHGFAYGNAPPNVPYQGTFMNPNQQQMGMSSPNAPQQLGQTFQTTLPNAQPPQGVPQSRPEPTPELIKQKSPLPEEYIYLQTVFNELRTHCAQTASNPVSVPCNNSIYYLQGKKLIDFSFGSANQTKIR